MATKSASTVVSVPRWLILGSFPIHDPTGGHLRSGLKGEEVMAPAAGQARDGRAWKPWPGDIVDFLNPALGFKDSENCFAYAFTYLHSPRVQSIQILAGSDDGIAIWLNGRQVHYNNTYRGVCLDEDVVPAVLRTGWNRLLVKVAQGAGSWGFVVRLKGAGIGAVTFSLRRPGAAAQGAPAAGLTPSFGVPALRVVPDGEDFRLALPVRLFNESARKAERVVLALVDDRGERLAQGAVAPIAGYESVETELSAPGRAVCAALGDGRALAVRVESSLGTASLAVEEAAADVFLGAVLGFDVPPGTAEVTLPAAYRGQPALLDIESAHDQNLPSWMVADWPHGVRRELAPEATAQGAVRVDIPAPAALPEPRTRLTVGDGDLREVIRRVRFLVREMNVGLGEAAEACRQGLRALAQGSFAGAAQALREVERGLAAAQPDRRAEQVTLVGHAHIDMNWLWAMAETRQVCHDTFRQVLSFMDEFPPFTFSQSQASTYQLLERLDPALFERLRQRVKEGRWELLGGMVDEGDTNLSSGEALARSFLLGQGYFLKTFDRLATVGWLPDNFGHVAQLPQILRLAGIGSFYGHRCMPKQGPFVWEGSDGSRVLVYVTPTYNGEITPRLRDLPAEYDPQHRKLIWVYGVGDHGGGPTRRDVTRAIAYDRMPGFPTIRFGTAEEFFRSLAPDVPDYPVHRGELQYIFEGCYTSIARIKEGNRRCESSLYGGELLSALLSLDGFRYPADTLRAAWQTLAFNQFHDILCGSAVHESNRESIAAYDVALDQAEEVRYSALRTLASKVPTAAARGQPVVVFNPLARPVTDVVEAELFTYLQPPTARLQGWGTGGTVDPATFVSRAKPVDLGQGPYATIALADEAGAPVDAQIVEGKVFPHGYRIKVRLVAKDVPACGHRLFYARPAECPGKPQATLEVTGTTVQTPFLRVEVNPRTGHVTRIYDRVRRKEVLAKGAKANRLRIFMEKPHGMSAWNLGPISAVHELDKAEAVKVVEEGPVRAVIQVWRKWNRSAFVQRIIAHRDLPRVDFELDAHWFELGGPRDDAPMLRVAFPLNVKKGRFVCDTPFAAVERPTNGREVPAQKWTDLSSAVSGGAALLNAGKYGHRCEGATLEMTLLRASYEPDPYPDQGPHLIRYSLVPHAGDWKAAGVDEAGQRFNTPLMALETPPGQKGELGASGSLLSLGPDNLLLAAVKRAEDEDGLIVRFVESRGQTANAELTVPKAPKSAARVDLLERPLEGGAAPLLDGRSVRVAVRPHEIVSLRLRF